MYKTVGFTPQIYLNQGALSYRWHQIKEGRPFSYNRKKIFLYDFVKNM